MTADPNTLPAFKTSAPYGTKILTVAATVWFTVATIGQWLFATYIILFYGKSTFSGDFARWNKVLPHGYVAGDWKGNMVVGLHVLLAAIMVVGGPLQLIPMVRSQFPRFHRWLGRLYVTTAIIVSTTGLIMVWTRGSVGDTIQHICISVQAIYIISFALLTINYARKRQFAKHRLWALRLYMVANGVWFFRVGLMAWLLINGGPAGFDPDTFTGPFLTVFSIITYAVPLSLVVLEMYVYAQRKQNATFSLFTAGVIFFFTIIMGIGIVGATMGMWLPRL